MLLLKDIMAKRRGGRSKRAATKASKTVAHRSTPEKIKLVVKNLIMFLIFFAISFIFYKVISNAFWNDLFFLFCLVFGFVALAFFIVWLVLKMMQWKK